MRIRAPVTLALIADFLAACASPTNSGKPCQFASADATVSTTSSNTFDPNAATITHGNKVCWQNSSTVLHTVTADNGAFDTNLPAGQVFVYTFATAGMFTYHCRVHAGMTGAITVN